MGNFDIQEGVIMKLIINGREDEIQAETLTVNELLALKTVDRPEMVSVELNGQFLSRADLPGTQLKSGDQLEFVYFMGGGQREV
jgi:sulfur carrier protein